MTSTFEWGDGVITVTATNIKTRLKENRYNRLVNASAIDDEFEAELVSTATYYLAHIECVEGDVGFNIPSTNASKQDVEAFIEAFSGQDERLMTSLYEGIERARNITNDKDLLPPQDVDPNA